MLNWFKSLFRKEKPVAVLPRPTCMDCNTQKSSFSMEITSGGIPGGAKIDLCTKCSMASLSWFFRNSTNLDEYYRRMLRREPPAGVVKHYSVFNESGRKYRRPQ